MKNRRNAATRSAMLAALASLTLSAAGCSVFDLGSHDSFEGWFIDDPQQAYSDLGAEGAGQICNATYGAMLSAPYGLRDVTRIAMIVFALPYYGAVGTVRRPSPSGQHQGPSSNSESLLPP